ncbi:MAG: hypothetical protein ABI671_20810 [Burkholderiales bacterium]
MEAAVWGLIGTLVGAFTSIATTWLSTRNSYNLQSSKLSEERAERGKTFQRETLLALQDAVHDALRLNARAHLEIHQASRNAGEWGHGLLTAEVDEGIRLANRKVSILAERIADDSLRASVKAITRLATEGRFLASEHQAELNQQRLASETVLLFERMGAVLRNNY